MSTYLLVAIIVLLVVIALLIWGAYIYGVRNGFASCFDVFDEKINAIPYGHTRKVVRKWYDSEIFKTVRQNGNNRKN